MTFRWSKGPVVPKSDFGDPPQGNPFYQFCVYDGRPVGLDLLPHGVYRGQPTPPCASSGCWRESSTGWKFKSPTGGADGIKGISLKEGLVPLKAKVQVKAKGGFGQGVLPFDESLPVTAQLRTSNGQCWGATFSAPTKHDAVQFVGKSD